MPAPEVILWQKLRGKLTGVKFRRQFSIDNYILDFYSPSCKLAVEIDGDSHYRDSKSQNRDTDRDMRLAGRGIKVLRFTNYEIMTSLEGVYSKIIEEIEGTTPSSSPPIRQRRTRGEIIERPRSRNYRQGER
ncbi:MAG: endonuclease domain-containing protein [Patescibacteria group bacterium]|nr:endonuclease domain-containing protein [Patescibacteria group bacterium]